jgi:DNA replication protein DnaC
VSSTSETPTDRSQGIEPSQDAGRGGSIASGVCPICKGAGYLLKDVPVGDPDFGRLYPCSCKVEELRHKQAQALREVSNLENLAHMTFATFIPEGNALNPDQQRNLRLAYEYAANYARNPQGWLVLRGGYGSGKTHLAAAIANDRLKNGHPALFVVVPDLLDHLRSAYSPTSDVTYDQRFEEIRAYPLLILDDLGSQSNTPWADEKLFQIFNYRYNARLPTVITTNCELEEIEIRIRSRLNSTDLVHMVPIMAPDYRASGVDHDQFELSSLGLHLDKTFATFDPNRDDLDAAERESLRRVFQAVQEFAEHPSDWLVLTGTYGCGKTHLAAAIANYQLARRHFAIFVVVPDLLDHLRATFSPQSTLSYDKLFDQVRRAPLLVLDDLGTESATKWAREKLYQLFNYRYNARLPTVITTAQQVEDELDPRLRSRILDQSRCQVWEILAPAYRGQPRPTAGGRQRRRRY